LFREGNEAEIVSDEEDEEDEDESVEEGIRQN
jgi:hypothetical protein